MSATTPTPSTLGSPQSSTTFSHFYRAIQSPRILSQDSGAAALQQQQESPQSQLTSPPTPQKSKATITSPHVSRSQRVRVDLGDDDDGDGGGTPKFDHAVHFTTQSLSPVHSEQQQQQQQLNTPSSTATPDAPRLPPSSPISWSKRKKNKPLTSSSPFSPTATTMYEAAVNQVQLMEKHIVFLQQQLDASHAQVAACKEELEKVTAERDELWNHRNQEEEPRQQHHHRSHHTDQVGGTDREEGKLLKKALSEERLRSGEQQMQNAQLAEEVRHLRQAVAALAMIPQKKIE